MSWEIPVLLLIPLLAWILSTIFGKDGDKSAGRPTPPQHTAEELDRFRLEARRVRAPKKRDPVPEAIPVAPEPTALHTAQPKPPAPRKPSAAERLRATMKDREAVRTAFLLREILDEPPGLR